MPETSPNDMPTAECPHCHKEFHWDDYWSLEIGDQSECPFCNQTIYVTQIDHAIITTLSTNPPQP